MQNHEREAQAPGLTLGDVYYVLFRHKWKIIGFSAAGLVLAALVFFFKPPVYSSEAKLFIRYVMESRVPSGFTGDPQIKTPDPGGANIINSEIEIIRSLDLAADVAEGFGPQKILGNGDTNKYTAAIALQKGVQIEVPPRSDILRIVFQSPNKDIVKPVLEQLIAAYLRKHVEIHRGLGTMDDVLSQQTDNVKTELGQTLQELRAVMTNAGLLSLEDSKKACTEQLAKIREELFNTQAELAENQAAAGQHPQVDSQNTDTNAAAAPAPPADKVEEYKSISARLDSFRKKEQELLSQFTADSSLVKGIHSQIESAEKTLNQLQTNYPGLAQVQVPSSKTGPAVSGAPDHAANIVALQAKLQVLTNQLAKLTVEARTINELEPTITELQRKKDIEETKYRHFSTGLDQARFDEALGAGKTSNITVAQTPSPPYRESRQMAKLLGIIAAGGAGLGLALAFVLELFVDPSVRRPLEVENRLHLPLFLTIPAHQKNGAAARALPPASEQSGTAPDSVVAFNPNGLRTYYEALRDRLVTYFEIRNLVHKPKLIAVTGCGEGAGVTTLATGLAASLSETGDGNVLLVDMTGEHGSAHPFFQGKVGCNLADALENEKRDNAMVQENLYAVAEAGNGDKLPRILPRRFNSLVPKLKASDYDYIIFDMPPVSQISVTPRLAGFMDMVLLVLESEKTDRAVAKRAITMLGESKANVSAILNKTRRYVPERLQQEL